jgi:hypothetical protein
MLYPAKSPKKTASIRELVSLDGVYLGEPRELLKQRDVSCEPYGSLEEIEFDQDGKVSWVSGNGYLETPKGCLHPVFDLIKPIGTTKGFCSPTYQDEIFSLGPPGLVVEGADFTCWEYPVWKLRIKFSKTFSRIELGTRHNDDAQRLSGSPAPRAGSPPSKP